MNKIMTLLAMLLITIAAAAHNDKKFDPEQFRKDQEAFITKEAKLTQKEAEAFFPLFNEYQSKKRQLLGKQMKSLKATPASEREAQKIIEELSELRMQEVKLDATYSKVFMKKLPATKVLKCIKAAERFKHRVMKRLMHHKDPQAKNNAGRGRQ